MIIRSIQKYLLSNILNADKSITFKVLHPGELTSAKLWEISQFREKNYLKTKPYLLEKDQLIIEENLQLDTRSYHIIALQNNGHQIIGTLRLTPYPFEISALSNEIDFSKENYKNKLESGRLVVDRSHRDLGKKLMIFAGIYIHKLNQYNGFIGICLNDRSQYFRNFGMFPISKEIQLKGRPGKYYIIASNFSKMTISVLRNYQYRFFIKPIADSHLLQWIKKDLT